MRYITDKLTEYKGKIFSLGDFKLIMVKFVHALNYSIECIPRSCTGSGLHPMMKPGSQAAPRGGHRSRLRRPLPR